MNYISNLRKSAENESFISIFAMVASINELPSTLRTDTNTSGSIGGKWSLMKEMRNSISLQLQQQDLSMKRMLPTISMVYLYMRQSD